MVAGGAGFLGSHLCDRLVERGDSVVCLDDLSTGSKDNVAHLLGHDRFGLVVADVCVNVDVGRRPGRRRVQPGLARRRPRPTWPGLSSTLAVGSEGTRRLLELARAHGARFLMASHQRGLRRPRGAPPGRVLPRQRRPHGTAQRLRRGQAVRREPDHGHAPRRRRRRGHRPHLQHLRARALPGRREGRLQLRRAGPARRAPDGLRRRLARPAASATSTTRSGVWSPCSTRT